MSPSRMREPHWNCWITDARVFVSGPRGARAAASWDGPPPSAAAIAGPAIAAAAREALTTAGWGGPAVHLTLPLACALTRVLGAVDGPTTPQAWRYALEEFLPCPLESLTCGFARLADDRVLAVAIPTDPTRALVDAFQGCGIPVGPITVDAAALALAGGPPTALVDRTWTRVALDASTHDVAGVLLDARGDVRDELASRGVRVDDVARVSIAGAADDAVRRVTRAANGTVDRLNLRSDALAPPGRWSEAVRVLNHGLIGAAALLTLLIVFQRIELRDRRDQLAALDARRLEVYRRVFDAPALPLGSALRLASERIRLEGLTRAPSPESAPVPPPLDTLRELVAGLPADLRIMLTRVAVDDRRITARGQTPSHRDAERIVEVINGLEDWSAGAPRSSRRTDGGVDFSIVAVARPGTGRVADAR